MIACPSASPKKKALSVSCTSEAPVPKAAQGRQRREYMSIESGANADSAPSIKISRSRDCGAVISGALSRTAPPLVAEGCTTQTRMVRHRRPPSRLLLPSLEHHDRTFDSLLSEEQQRGDGH